MDNLLSLQSHICFNCTALLGVLQTKTFDKHQLINFNTTQCARTAMNIGHAQMETSNGVCWHLLVEASYIIWSNYFYASKMPISQYQTSQIEVQGTYCPPNECPVMTIWVTSSRTLSVKNWAIFDRVYPGNHITFSETSTTRFGFIPEWTTNYLPISDAKTQRCLTLAIVLSLMNISTTGCNRTLHINLTTPKKQMSHLAKSICATRSSAQKHHLAHIFASAPATNTRVQKKNRTFNGCRFLLNKSTRPNLSVGFRQIRSCQKIGGTNIRNMKLSSDVLRSNGTPSSEIR